MIKIYSLPNCKHCKEVKDYLNERDLNFIDIDLKTKDNIEARKYWRSIGVNIVPIIVVSNENTKDNVHVFKDMKSFIEFIDNYASKEKERK